MLSGCVIGIYSFRSSESFFQLDNTKHNLILILALKPILGKILLGISTPKLDIQDFVYISVICKATSVRSSVGLKYQLECDKVQQLQTHCGHALFLGANHCTKIFCFCVHSGALALLYPGTSLYEHILRMRLEKNQNLHMHIVVIILYMLQDNKLSIFLFITWHPPRGSGLHSFESFSFVNIALSRFIS